MDPSYSSPNRLGFSSSQPLSDRSEAQSSGRFPAVRGSEAKYQIDRDSPSHNSSSIRSPQPPTHFDPAASGDDSFYPQQQLNPADVNPFTLPKEDVFLLREREKELKLRERDTLRQMKIWEKPAKSSQLMASTQQIISSSYQDKLKHREQYMTTAMNSSQSLANRALHPNGVGQAAISSAAGGSLLSASSSLPVGGNGAGKDRMFQGRRPEKENMADFIAKKRDMFLIQMSLDTKRSEIQKLEEKAQMKEDALKKSEMMLEEDAMRFDAFLKENDRKAHDALKRADLETKEKQEKVLEIKKLNAEISKVENEMSKYEEQLLACMKYKDFLDSLTPKEYLLAKQERAALKKRKKQQQQQLQDGQQQQDEKENSASNEQQLDGGAVDDDSDDEEETMYFTQPEQLLEIFAQLEERNLFLIQNVQETEEALDELNQKFEETKKSMEEKTNLLHSSIADLKQKIRVENEKAANLKKRAGANRTAGNQQKLLAVLSEKVTEVYGNCGMDPDTQTDTLDMLRDIEQWLEQLLHAISHMDSVKVEFAEKKKNAERRNQIRAIKKEEQKRQYEERLAKSTARAKAEVIKQTGKQVMFRSPPIRKKKKKEDVVFFDEEAEQLKRFFT